ncbi:acetyl-CoA carboxylase biotin carboxyl carrier protein [Micromonospora arida]|uniref:Biotin carboxyl carrier protein of acetyl-CoA carboxylase n=1 Tax=Micromonospora arida TaxID=2203715 RepID=A0A3N9WR81_9ACTN|nr:biotin/lipoyl-containing protein [Micromonospora arida]RQX03209.1 acetyl-CoA carboxylase, biotin carboxyl carrier protein [Micromonospora arida]
MPEGNADPLDAAVRSLARLIGSTPGPVRRARLQHGDLVVEVEWPDGAPGVAAVAPVPPVEADAGLHYVCAPMVATLYLAPSPGADPFVREGDQVVPGQQVAILEAMKMMIPVEADRAGEVVKVLVPNATPVEYGERLIALAVSEG